MPNSDTILRIFEFDSIMQLLIYLGGNMQIDCNSISIGNSGEYFVAAELERRGYTAAVPMSNTKDFDILAINRTTHKQIAIQVKTTRHCTKKWMLTQKCESLKAPNIKYVLVVLNNLNNPEYHIVPSEYLAETVSKLHKDWLNTPGKNGQSHNDNPARYFYDETNTFLNRWDLLEE